MFKRIKSIIGNHKEFSKTIEPGFSLFSFKRLLNKTTLYSNISLIVTVVIITFLYIGNRYSCEVKLSEIDNLQMQLIDVKFDALTRSSELLEISRQSQVKSLILEKNINLKESTTPPYRIKSE